MKDLIQTMGFRFGHPRLRTRGQRTFLAGALTLSLWNAPECGAAPDVLARLVPMPRQTTLTGGLLPLAGPWALAISTRSPADSLAARQLAEEAARRGWSWRMSASRPGVRQVVWEEAALGSPEGYRLVLEPDRIVVGAATPAGRHYAVQTLRQILRTSDAGTVPACIIDDAPALGTRGISIDISRGQIPTTDALAATIRTLAYYKLNTLFLYIENSFAFPSAPGAHAPDALDEHDARTLRLVADSCGVELIPIVQSLSH